MRMQIIPLVIVLILGLVFTIYGLANADSWKTVNSLLDSERVDTDMFQGEESTSYLIILLAVTQVLICAFAIYYLKK